MSKKTLLNITLSLILTNIFFMSFSQKAPEKFGKISKADFGPKYCPIDSNAHAYFIFDYGLSDFKYFQTKVSSSDVAKSRKGFQLYFTRHFRIKIVDNQGFPWANIEIPLYHDGDEERVTNIKAYTYNLENDKIVKTKLDKKGILIEKTSKYWNTEKFAMLNVREGSIIEIKYTIVSDYYFNLREWYFQKTIPVLQSEYHVSMPEYFNFNQTQKGYFPIQMERDGRQEDITITYHQKAEGSSVKEQTYTNTYNYREDILHFYAKGIPAFPIEKYLRTKDNYLSKVEFELQYTKFPNSPIKYYTTSWKDINNVLLGSHNFGKELSKASHLKKEVEILKNCGQEGYMLLNSAFNHVKSKLAWNGYKSKYVTESLSKAYKTGGGNCADINLNLVVLLRELGFNAYPVLLSTQEHGIIHPSHPSISRFNYVIAMVRLYDKTYLLDATDPCSEINLLPIRCLNDKGRIINKAGGEWVNLADYRPYSSIEVRKVTIDKDLVLSGTNNRRLKDYAAYECKKKIKECKNVREYEASIDKQDGNLTIGGMEISGLDTMKKSINISYQFTENNYIDKTNDIAFFSPAFQSFISENPFKLDKREYPVEFNYPYSVRQIYVFTIPENYEVSEIPKPVVVKMPDNSAKFIYNINQMGNTVNLSLMFSIKKTLFLPEEYMAIKNFYQKVIDKQKELIVLKSIE